MQSKRTPASSMALGGILAALAVIFMSLGTLIPIATYACPLLCAMLLQLVLKLCGQKIALGWFGAVSILSLLMAPDKEAAAIFLALGYYPILKPRMDSLRGKWFWKGLFFNGVILITYWLLMHLVGFDQLSSEFAEMGMVMTVILLVLGNLTFFLLDKLLERKFKRS